jgi:S-adenosylmethionine:tRNA ribosyltransferase-isomerase
MRLDDFDYVLPERLIAQVPPSERGGSRLLCVDRNGCRHEPFSSFPAQLRAGDLLVVNDTRVIKARLMARKDSGGQAEILVERIEADDVALCQVRVSKPLKPGRTLTVGDLTIRVGDRAAEFYRLVFPAPVLDVLESAGSVPLPTYIDRCPATEDEERYQTVYASRPGAVAAPTAGLHFSAAMLAELPARGVEVARVTLHVGAGTFQPVRVNDISQHRMHSERYEIAEDAALAVNRCRGRGGRVVAVGTTVVRTLESAPVPDGRVRPGQGDTDLFITPGFSFQVVDALLTNFHLPRSTLMMLVCAFGGYDRVMAAYRTAVAEGYRFFSYGDAMFLERMTDV